MIEAVFKTLNPSDQRLAIAATFAALLHIMIITGLSFARERASSILPPSLEVILLNSATVNAPDETDYLANINSEGGGTLDERTRPSSPFFSDEPVAYEGVAPNPQQAAAPEQNTDKAQRIINSLYSSLTLTVVEKTTEQTTPQPLISEQETEATMALAKMTAEINDRLERYAKRPRKTFVSARARATPAAEYMFNWVEQIERLGNLNYPQSLRDSGLSGTVVLTVGISRSGELESVAIKRSSGWRTLDNAAVKLVELGAPYAPLNSELLEDTDVLYITRSWRFNSNATVVSDA